MEKKNKKKTSKNKCHSKLPQLTSCAYSFASIISAQLNTEQLFKFAIFLNTVADLIVLNAQERQVCENPDNAEELEQEFAFEDLLEE